MKLKEEEELSSATSVESLDDTPQFPCTCPTDTSTINLFRDFIQKIDESQDAMDNSCQNIISGQGSIYDAQSIYGHLKHFETAFAQMAQMALECENAQKIAKPLIEKSEKIPIITMVEVAGTNFLDDICFNHPHYYHYLRTKFYQIWPEVDHHPKH